MGKKAAKPTDAVYEIFTANAATNQVQEASMRALLSVVEELADKVGQPLIEVGGKALSVREAFYARRDEKLQALLLDLEKTEPALAAHIQKMIDEKP